MPMIVSHACKFIFLKTEKTAGTSIEAALSELCGPLDIITPFREESESERRGRRPQNYRIEHPLKPKRPLWRTLLLRPERYYHPSVGYYEHMPAWRVRDYVGEQIWQSYFKFAFVRNPWDRQVSQYLYKTKSKRVRPSLERFMARKKRAYVTSYEIYTIDSEIAVDYVGHYESLDQDLQTALERARLTRRLEIPRINVTAGRDRERSYRSYYTPATQALVAQWYAPEIAMWDYKF
jgi:hypothetical protein